MKKIVFTLLLITGCCFIAGAQDMSKMKTYYLVLLKKGPNRSHDSATAAGIQAAHMAHINKMAEDGKLAMAGPCTDNSDLRGIFVFNVASMEEARALTEADPAVKAGRLIMEIHPWMSERGVTLP